MTQMFTRHVELKKLKLNVELQEGMPQMKGEEVRIQQVLMVLIENAIKFTEKGSVDLKVMFMDQVSKVKFIVKDTGIGMTR